MCTFPLWDDFGSMCADGLAELGPVMSDLFVMLGMRAETMPADPT